MNVFIVGRVIFAVMTCHLYQRQSFGISVCTQIRNVLEVFVLDSDLIMINTALVRITCALAEYNQRML